MSIQPQTEEYLAARIESCRLLGLNPDDLTAHEAIRADLATVLRLWLDGSQSTLLAGGSADPVKLLSVVEALTKLVPEREQHSHREDPRQIMWETYLGMRRRGELADATSTFEGRGRRIAELEAEIAALKDVRPTSDADASAPAGGNVVKLHDNPGRSSASSVEAKAAHVQLLREPAAVDVNALPPAEPEPWRAFVNADGSINSRPRGRWDV